MGFSADVALGCSALTSLIGSLSGSAVVVSAAGEAGISSFFSAGGLVSSGFGGETFVGNSCSCPLTSFA